MKWENLKTGSCPYCEGHLEKNVIDGVEVFACENCYFSIDIIKAKSILIHRGNSKAGIKMRWQNLRDFRCPLCAEKLKEEQGKFDMTNKCSREGCGFSIQAKTFDKILSDPDHSANRYPIDENDFIEEEENAK